MVLKSVIRVIIAVIGCLVMLLMSLGLLGLGIRLFSEGYWVVGLTVAISGIIGCRVLAKIFTKWAQS
ncbi:MAG: hypothetical protein U9Q03_06460 [Patescibacteria group bacterium]|nr:hypothetical protein [Patescibacteria group bacterium]